MKKLLLSSILALAGLGLSAVPSHAWTFGLIPYHCWPCGECWGCCGGGCGKICIRPYNAFSPSASGCMTFDGCNPFCGGGYPGYGPGGCPGGRCGHGRFGMDGYAGDGIGMDLPDGGDCCAPADPAAPPAKAVPAAPTLAPPPASPIAPAAPGTGALLLPNGAPIQAAGGYGR
ncbi:MAG TPA: hypothetical protein VMS17_04005 [Gemmataceae bacterium]|nr:hypothetical protein [Gemmataceae bacterium]